MSDSVTCLRPDCGEPVYQRGLCKRDNEIAGNLVRAGTVTWEALEVAGKALPFKRTGPKSAGASWLLDGVEHDGIGKPLRVAVDEAVAAGVAPLAIYEGILKGYSSTGATKAIRNAAKRHERDHGEPATCACGCGYIVHDLRFLCTAYERGLDHGAEVEDEEDDGVPPPVVDSARIEREVLAGVPPGEIMETLGVARDAILRVQKRLQDSRRLPTCRCTMAYGHPSRCLSPKLAVSVSDVKADRIDDLIRNGVQPAKIASRLGVEHLVVRRRLEEMRKRSPLEVPDECECGNPSYPHLGSCRAKGGKAS